MINIIACVGQNQELGFKGDLVFHLKKDMAFFKQTTMNHPVLMGLKTCESLPHALPGRTNYVLTYNPDSLPNGFIGVTDLEGFFKEHQKEDIFVIGGGMVYRQALAFADILYLTEVEASAKADVFFPDFDKSKYNRVILEQGEENGVIFTIAKYIRR